MKILIVGASIAGLTFARAIQCFQSSPDEDDLNVDIAESSPGNAGGFGIVLHPNGLEVLNILGLGEILAGSSNIIREIKLNRHDHADRILLNKVWGEEKVTRVISRKCLHQLLWQSICENDSLPVRIKTGYKLKNVLRSGDQVKAVFENGECTNYDLVIGADGINSAVRNSIYPEISKISTGQLYCRFTSPNLFGFENHIWNVFDEQPINYGFIPLPKNQLHCFAQLSLSGEIHVPDDKLSLFKNTIAPGLPLLQKAFDNRDSEVHTGVAYMIQPGFWGDGRILLIGDSAHAISPTLSEGGSLAMEDGLVLALILCATKDPTSILSRFKEARDQRCQAAYRMGLAQLNSLRKRATNRVSAEANTNLVDASTVMAGMYKQLSNQVIPDYLQHILTKKLTV